jgi:hypothetical protein
VSKRKRARAVASLPLSIDRYGDLSMLLCAANRGWTPEAGLVDGRGACECLLSRLLEGGRCGAMAIAEWRDEGDKVAEERWGWVVEGM